MDGSAQGEGEGLQGIAKTQRGRAGGGVFIDGMKDL